MICANNHSVRKFLESEFWKPENGGNFSETITIDFLNAPAGMKQHMNAFETRCCFEWLTRTVKTWHVNIEDFYAGADRCSYWSIGTWGGDVCWGQKPGRFEAKFILRIELSEGSVYYMKVMTNPLAMLRAAGREVPIFHMDTEAPEVKAYLQQAAAAPQPPQEPLETGPDACRERIQNTLNCFLGFDAPMCMAADCDHSVLFLPPEMHEHYSAEDLPAVEAWSALSNITEGCYFNFLPSGKVYPTENPLVYFGEFHATGKMNWLGNPVTGHYHNTYLYIICFNALGQVTRYEEYMDPMNKFNSIDTSIPTFPYYF